MSGVRLVEAYSQVSRFHAETLSTSYDVDLKQVNVAVGQLDLLCDARLQLLYGRHYAMIGRNGSGKTTLLNAIARGELVGWPPHVKVSLVSQELVGREDQSVLQAVLESDAELLQLRSEAEALENALASSDDDPGALVALVARLHSGAADADARAADMTAMRRSGRRGKAAQKVAIEADARARDVAAAGASFTADEAAGAAHEMLAERYEQLADRDADADEARAAEILVGLGFDVPRQAAPTSALSGGWRMRAALAAALFSPRHLLLLDEPTNHLDLEGILWLQDWLASRRGALTVLIVSHDRAFLNAVGEELVLLRDKGLTYFTGTYDAYVSARAEARAAALTQLDAQARQRKHIEESIAAAERTARSTGDDKRLGMVASRKKKLENRMGAQRTATGGRFKVSYWVGYHETMRPQIVLDKPEPEVTFKLPVACELRYGGPVLQLCAAGYAYPGSAAARPVIVGATLDVAPGARIGLVGANGGGKSTLMRLISGALEPTAGRVERHAALRLGVFDQDAVLALGGGGGDGCDGDDGGASTPPQHPSSGGAAAADTSPSSSPLPQQQQSPLSLLTSHHPELREQEARDYLAGFGLKDRLPLLPLSALSGGQRVRLGLALALWGGPSVLLLDEPTNHLDLEAVEALASALRAYGGAVVLASHDRRLLGEVCDDLYAVGGGGVARLEEGGAEGVASYAARVLARVRRRGGGGGGKVAAAAAVPVMAAASKKTVTAATAKAAPDAAAVAAEGARQKEREAAAAAAEADAEAKRKVALTKQRAQAKAARAGLKR